MDHSNPPECWTVIVPLKATSRGKSRINVEPRLRRRLALAMATDTVATAAAAVGVGEVLVVVEDTDDGRQFAGIQRVTISATRTSSLNAAIKDGLDSARTSGPLAVLPADLPSLTSNELETALAMSLPHRRTVVADRQGIGTTLLTASSGALEHHYGPGSLRRHLKSGAVLLDIAGDSGLRRDVDRIDDLACVTGQRTRAVLAAEGLTGSAPDHRLAVCLGAPG